MNADQTDQGESDYLVPADAARLLGVTVRSVARYADAGRIRAVRPGGHRRYLRADVEELLRR